MSCPGKQGPVRRLGRTLAAAAAIAAGATVSAQQQPDGSYRPTAAQVSELVGCEAVDLSGQGQDARIRFGVFDRASGLWLIVGDRRDEIVSCLVRRHGWSAMIAPDGRRVVRAPR